MLDSTDLSLLCFLLLDMNGSTTIEGEYYLRQSGVDTKATSFVIVAAERVHPHSIIFDFKVSYNRNQQ